MAHLLTHLATQLFTFAVRHWLAIAASLSLLAACLQLLRHAFSDADFGALAALRGYPRRGAFKGKVVFIAGASSGIGEALALEFARGGATVVVGARRMPQLVQVAERCLAEGAPKSEAVSLDVTAFEKVEGVVAHIVRKHGRIDILCNNAGRSQRGLVERTPLEVDRDMFTLNVFGTLSVTKAVLKHALGQEGGLHIVNTSSVAGKVGSPVSACYAATKHAVQGYFDSLRMELGHRGVTVTNVCPGPVHSEIALHSFTDVPGVAVGVKEDGSKRMSAERCALLMAAATHSKLQEVWLAPQPILFFVYVGQYLRSLYFYLSPIVGKQRVQAWLATAGARAEGADSKQPGKKE